MLELPSKSPVVWRKFFKENKSLVFRYVVKEVNKALQKDLPKVELFRFKNSANSQWVYKKDYMNVLQDAMSIFVQNEDYEDAGKVKHIIDRYHIEQLIKESSTEV